MVDDHQVLLDGIAALLAGVAGMRVVGTAHNGQEAIAALRATPTDVVLMDIRMPVMDGLEATAAIKEEFPQVRVIAMSMHGEGRLVEAMLARGANGYLLKNCGGAELLEAIRAVHEGRTWLSREVTEELVQVIRAPQERQRPEPLEEITRRERDVLRLIVAERTTAEIATELGITVNTVESHRRQLLQKLGARNSAGLVRMALEMGLLEPGSEQR